MSGSEQADQPRFTASVLVLGATGFMGRALVEHLLEEGVSLRALVRDPSDLESTLARSSLE